MTILILLLGILSAGTNTDRLISETMWLIKGEYKSRETLLIAVDEMHI